VRELIFDTETTGLDPKTHRLVSIAVVELVHGALTGRFCYYHLNPERPNDPRAQEIHGLTDEYLATCPKFADIATPLMEFIGTSRLVAHNARFDLGFLSEELDRAQFPTNTFDSYHCTYQAAVKRRGMGKGRNTLDTLTEVYKAPNYRAATGKHGALIDALTLLGVYGALSGRHATRLVQSQLDHFTQGFGIHGPFAESRTGSQELPSSAQPLSSDQSPDLCSVGGGDGQDVLGTAALHHAPEAGAAEPVRTESGDHSCSGRV
jgi:DNA polymerase-3 subunit epsilon